MKKSLLILNIFLATLGGMSVFSQDDSLHIETEYPGEDERYYQQKYMYLDVNLSDDHKLLKLGIQPFKPNENYEMTVFMIHGGFEQKLGSSFSLVNELNAIMLWSGGEVFHQLGYSFGGRYYFKKKREMARGRSGDNCNGLYFHLKMSDLLGFYTLKGVDVSEPGDPSRELYRSLDYAFKPELGFGIQQKIRQHLYFDANVYFNLDLIEQKPGFGITFLFGGVLDFTR